MNTPEIKIAMATFVKTPGMSPIKTRLAASIGAAEALAFYIESVGRTYEMIEKLKFIVLKGHDSSHSVSASRASATPVVTASSKQKITFQPYWAVAEKQAMGALFWQKWPQLWQGDGDLGERIATVYTQLKEKYDIVALYGADSPHIDASRFKNAFLDLVENKFSTTVGPTEDGGFYFLASRLQLPATVWHEVEYSASNTLAQLQKKWPGEMHALPRDFDIDTIEDLKRLRGQL